MFSRRKVKNWKRKTMEWIWPSMGVVRLALYYKHRIGRSKESSTAIAIGFACGVAISFTPFIGLHLLLAGLVTWLMAGSLTALLVGSVVAGNPWTFPIIWVATYKLGRLFLGKTAFIQKIPDQFTFYDLLSHPVELLLPMILGSLPFVIVSWIIAFYFARRVVNRYKEKSMAIRYKNGEQE